MGIIAGIALSAGLGLAFAQTPVVHYTADCVILDKDAKILGRLPGQRCELFDNGELLSANDSDITYFEKSMKVKWKRKLALHHFMDVSLDGKSIYALGTSVHPGKCEKQDVLMRYEAFYKLDLATGETQAVYDTYENYEEFAKIAKLNPDRNAVKCGKIADKNPYTSLEPRPTHEFTHFNSIREVPPNKLNFFKAGEVIINANFLGYNLVFDHELKHPLSSFLVSEVGDCTHAANVTPAGTLLLFINSHIKEVVSQYSSLVEWDPVSKEIIWSFLGVEGHRPFYADTYGYVEEVGPGRILFSTRKFAYEIDRKGKVYWKVINKDLNGPLFLMMPIKKHDLTSFLNNNQN